MVKNLKLEDSVLQMMAEQVMQRDQRFNNYSKGNPEIVRGIIRKIGQTRIDEGHKVRIHFGGYIGYGYDFNELGTQAREGYMNALNNTRKKPWGTASEELIHDEIKDDRFGLYLTSIS